MARRLRIEENHKVDVGGEIQLMRAKLAHAEQDPARLPRWIVEIRQFELALAMRVAQQEVDGGARAGIGQVTQPPYRQRRFGLAGKIGQRDQEMRLGLPLTQFHHQAGFRDCLGQRRAIDRGADRFQPSLDRLVEKPVQDPRPATRRIAQERRQVEDSCQEVLALPLAGQEFGQPRQAFFACRGGDLGQFLPRIGFRPGEKPCRRLQQPLRLRPLCNRAHQ